jgi:hypothetical protein
LGVDILFKPKYNSIFSSKKLLIEKLSLDFNEVWKNHLILEFESCQFLVKTDFHHFDACVNYVQDINVEYYDIKFLILENLGSCNGKSFLDWIVSFYDDKNNYYRFNVYDLSSKNIQMYRITKSMKKVSKIQAISCVIKKPIFFHKRQKNYPQFAITLCTNKRIVEVKSCV